MELGGIPEILAAVGADVPAAIRSPEVQPVATGTVAPTASLSLRRSVVARDIRIQPTQVELTREAQHETSSLRSLPLCESFSTEVRLRPPMLTLVGPIGDAAANCPENNA